MTYRPISVLTSLSKILEEAAYLRLYDYLYNHSIITQLQFCFRPFMSTEIALQCFTNHVLNAFDMNQFTIGVFIDLSKAFDIVNHKILLDKLFYGITGNSHC